MAQADPARAFRICRCTGGKNHRPFGSPKPNSECAMRQPLASEAHAQASAYDWQFIPQEGKSLRFRQRCLSLNPEAFTGRKPTLAPRFHGSSCPFRFLGTLVVTVMGLVRS